MTDDSNGLLPPNDDPPQDETSAFDADDTASCASPDSRGSGSVPSFRPPEIPPAIGNVRIDDEIGRGGMGIVYSGWDEVLHRMVAVKFLLAAVKDQDDPHFEQFFGGARAEAAVRHPNIVAVHDAGTIGDTPYMIMEFVDGPTVAQLLRGLGRLPLPAALKVIWDTISAVGSLHTNSLIHRDAKPSNVILDHNAHVFVTDFGLAALRRRPSSAASCGGTPTYMAPEAFSGQASPQTDFYAIGIMLFELLAGTPPFQGDLASLRKQHESAALPIDVLDEAVPPQLVEVLERATHKREIFRFKRAEHFHRALRDAGTTSELLHEGETSLKRLVLKVVASAVISEESEPEAPSSTTPYFERLSEIAGEKRTTRGSSGSLVKEEDEGETSASDTGTAAEAGSSVELSTVDYSSGDTKPARGEVPCAGCAEPLTIESTEDECPQCGASIKSSIDPRRLLFADRRWMKRCGLGMTVLLATVTLIPVLLLIACVVLASHEAASSISDTRAITAIVLLLSVAIPVAIGVVVGTFLATESEPAADDAPPPKRLGYSVRSASLVCLACLTIGTVGHWGLWPRPPFTVWILAGISMAMWGICYLLHTASLIERFPSAEFAKRVRQMAGVCGAGLILSALAAVVWYLPQPSLGSGDLDNPAPGGSAFFPFAVAVGLYVLAAVPGLIATGLSWRIRQVMRGAINR